MEAILSLNTSTNYINHIASTRNSKPIKPKISVIPSALIFSAPLRVVKSNKMSGSEYILQGIWPAGINNQRKFTWGMRIRGIGQIFPHREHISSITWPTLSTVYPLDHRRMLFLKRISSLANGTYIILASLEADLVTRPHSLEPVFTPGFEG